MHAREARDAEDGQEAELATGKPQATRAHEGDRREEDESRAGRAELGEPEGRKSARINDHLGHGGVDRPEADGGYDQPVAEHRPFHGSGDSLLVLGRGQGRIDHGARG